MIKRQHLASLFLTMLLTVFSSTALASGDVSEDPDLRMVNAKVVEVTKQRIAVIAETGVEHVIAINDTATKVEIEGEPVALNDLSVGDIVTVELDAQNPLKFARNIVIEGSTNTQFARARK